VIMISSRSQLLLIGTFFLLLTILTLVLLAPNALAASKIYGTVTDAETEDPIQEADVQVWDPEDRKNYHKTTTDRDGYYEVEVDPGHYNISISKDGYQKHTGEEDVGPEQQVEHNAELIPEEMTYLEGYVIDADTEEPIQYTNITVFDRKDKFMGKTDGQGYYNLSCKEGEYNINITHENYESHENKIWIEAGANSYDTALSPNDNDGRNGANKGGGDDDDDSFQITGSDVLMVSGWIVAAVVIVLFVVQMKRNEEQSEEEESEDEDE